MPPDPDDARPRKRWRWLRRDAINLGDVVVQVFSVVVGILLALFINDRVMQRQQQQTVDEAMRAIHAELVANRAALHQSAAQLTAMAVAMRDSPGNQNESPRWCFQWDGWNGTNTANLVDAAYQTAIATLALSHMPFTQAQRVAQAYGHQRIHQNAFDMVHNRILVAGPQPLEVCLTGILGIIQDEHALDAMYGPLIGPDQTAWPTPLPPPSPRHHITK